MTTLISLFQCLCLKNKIEVLLLYDHASYFRVNYKIIVPNKAYYGKLNQKCLNYSRNADANYSFSEGSQDSHRYFEEFQGNTRMNTEEL